MKIEIRPCNLNWFESDIPGTFWFGRFDVIGKMFQIEETNVGIAIALARLGDEDVGHFSSQKSVKIKRAGYT